MLGGYRTPERTVIGMMIPGLPVMALGRNDDIAWGGTNMIGLSSSLYDVSSLDESSFPERTEPIEVRWWFDSEVTVRETPFGPLLSDAPWFEEVGEAFVAGSGEDLSSQARRHSGCDRWPVGHLLFHLRVIKDGLDEVDGLPNIDAFGLVTVFGTIDVATHQCRIQEKLVSHEFVDSWRRRFAAACGQQAQEKRQHGQAMGDE